MIPSVRRPKNSSAIFARRWARVTAPRPAHFHGQRQRLSGGLFSLLVLTTSRSAVARSVVLTRTQPRSSGCMSRLPEGEEALQGAYLPSWSAARLLLGIGQFVWRQACSNRRRSVFMSHVVTSALLLSAIMKAIRQVFVMRKCSMRRIEPPHKRLQAFE